MNIGKKVEMSVMAFLLLSASVLSAEGIERLSLDLAVRIALERNLDVLSAQTERRSRFRRRCTREERSEPENVRRWSI